MKEKFSFFSRNIGLKLSFKAIDYAVYSDKGGRSVNEDYVLADACGERAVFMLADGLGGHGAGDEASRCVCLSAQEEFKKSLSKAPLQLLALMFDRSQRELLRLQQERHCTNSMKSTLNILLIDSHTAYWGHIGDSRIYRFCGGKIAERTLDHSVPQLLVATGEIRESQIRQHEDRNRLLRVMGTEWNEPKYELCDKGIEIFAGDAFLLCSDGFWEPVTENVMTRALRAGKTADEWLNAMKKVIINAGITPKSDNCSAIAIRLSGANEKVK